MPKGSFPMDDLLSLGANWDSYGSRPIDPACAIRARNIWRRLSGQWHVVPCSDGSVQLEQHVGGFDIEITVSKSNSDQPT